MINFTPDINLGNTIVTTLVAGVLWGMRMIYKVVAGAVDRHDQALEDVCDHAEVINLHTAILVRAGVAKGVPIPMVEERRKKPRIYPGGETV